MVRIAGNDRDYTFRLMRKVQDEKGDWIEVPSEWDFGLPSVSTILDEVMAKPFMAGAWWGYNVGLEGLSELLSEYPAKVADEIEEWKADLKKIGSTPAGTSDRASDRGSRAHLVLELLVDGKRDEAERLVVLEQELESTKYGAAVIKWWDEHMEGVPAIAISERPVWSLRQGYSGSFDLAIKAVDDTGWEIWDLKTHKPAAGFTLPHKGAAYLGDVTQVRFYRTAWEEMGMGDTIGQGILIARANGEYLVDRREVDPKMVPTLLSMYSLKQAFESA